MIRPAPRVHGEGRAEVPTPRLSIRDFRSLIGRESARFYKVEELCQLGGRRRLEDLPEVADCRIPAIVAVIYRDVLQIVYCLLNVDDSFA